MKNYLINVQFVNTTAKFGLPEKEAVIQAIKIYNSKSLIAKNPKKISDYSFSEDSRTLTLRLESEADLPVPTKALKLLSSYLVKETCLKEHLSGKQLFKMTAERATDSDKSSADGVPSATRMNLEEFKTLSPEKMLIEIYKLLIEKGV